MAMAGMQNGLFIVLPIGRLLFAEQFDQFALYCFLLVMGLTPLMWSLGKVMLASSRTYGGFHVKDLMTPPLVATFISVGLVFCQSRPAGAPYGHCPHDASWRGIHPPGGVYSGRDPRGNCNPGSAGR